MNSILQILTRKFKLNQIYNTHYTGSPLWNLFCAESVQFESCYNKSVKIMFDLPYATHRHLIEPVTGHTHVRTTLVSRFLGFIDQIKKSQKLIPKMFLNHIENDARSVTGNNLRRIMLQTNKLSVDSLCKSDCLDLLYHPTRPEDKWKEGILKELIQARENEVEIEGFNQDEISTMLENICVS